MDLRESTRLGKDWETILIEIPDIGTVMDTPPYKRDVKIISSHIGPIELGDNNRPRSKYFFQCVPDNPLPFLECCGICTERDLCQSLSTMGM